MAFNDFFQIKKKFVRIKKFDNNVKKERPKKRLAEEY